ncbi:protein B4 [Corythoichthys intestinalis]|uniref:protein B4 n=1 Tax=Corythoichthys intestinalis TaxID=161448 RepID=UPI0025A5725B|nr:protein B4 [Corythoichthys intestinalis]XP_061813662.1 protein B4-like [Nerophis lumbriciformis]
MPPKRRTITLNEKPASSGTPTLKVKRKSGLEKLRKLSKHPVTSTMVSEALKKLDSRKGVSKQAILNFIKLNYPAADPSRLNYHVRKALLKGLENGTLVRPANSTVTSGLNGKFRLAKTKETKAKAENVDPNVEKAPKKPKTKAVGTKKTAAEEPKSPKKEATKVSKKSKKEAPPSKVAPAKKLKASMAAEAVDLEENVKTKVKPKEVEAAEKTKPKPKAAKSKAEKEPAPKAAAKRGKRKDIE